MNYLKGYFGTLLSFKSHHKKKNQAFVKGVLIFLLGNTGVLGWSFRDWRQTADHHSWLTGGRSMKHQSGVVTDHGLQFFFNTPTRILIHCCFLKSYGKTKYFDGSFQCQAPYNWNMVLSHIRSSFDINTFKSSLKNFF